jgi:hypothetical protein
MRIDLSELLRRHLRWKDSPAVSVAPPHGEPDACRCYGCTTHRVLARKDGPQPLALSQQTTRPAMLPSGQRAP